MKKFITLFVLTLVFAACENSTTSKKPASEKVTSGKSLNSKSDVNSISCSEKMCQGFYVGPEFVDGSDIAHQFSNKMSAAVGDKLKLLYGEGQYSKVDFDNVFMSTRGMGSGMVTYELKIPFTRVNTKCESYTSFDHVGGWNHEPELAKRKNQLKDALLPGEELKISKLKKTDEGLQEYWIQWKNKQLQRDCKITR